MTVEEGRHQADPRILVFINRHRCVNTSLECTVLAHDPEDVGNLRTQSVDGIVSTRQALFSKVEGERGIDLRVRQCLRSNVR